MKIIKHFVLSIAYFLCQAKLTQKIYIDLMLGFTVLLNQNMS